MATFQWTPTLADSNAVTLGETCLPRLNIVGWKNGGFAASLDNGGIEGTCFTATKTETCNNIFAYTNVIAAGATPTLCKMGVYSIDTATNNMTLVSACANDTTLFSAATTKFTRALTTPFNKVAGKRYALVIIVVTAFTLPNFNGKIGNVELGPQMAPMLGARLTGQSDLIASISGGSLQPNVDLFYMGVTP